MTAIREAGGRAAAFAADVAEEAAVADPVAAAGAVLGPIDVLVNNAGIAVIRGLDELEVAEFDRTIAVNLRSAFLCTQRGAAAYAGAALGPHRQHQFGRGPRQRHRRCALQRVQSRHGGADARLRHPPRREGVTVNAIAPSLIDTDMINVRRDDSAAKYRWAGWARRRNAQRPR